MKLKDLKQGMVCKLRSGESITILNSGYSSTSDLTIFTLEKNFNEDLTHKKNKHSDIMEITFGDKVVFKRNESRWFVPEIDEVYFYIDEDGDVCSHINSQPKYNYDLFNNNRVFKTEEEVEKRLRQQQATLSVERWIAENDVEVDVFDTNVKKCSFVYDFETQEFDVIASYYRVPTPKQFILSSEEKAEQLIKEREKELKIMFGVEE